MSIRCPHCAFHIDLKGARAGSFQPKCPRCGEKFELVVYPDAGKEPSVTKLNTSETMAPTTQVGAKPQATNVPLAASHVRPLPKKKPDSEIDSSIADALGLDDDAQATLPPTSVSARHQQTRPPRAGETSVPHRAQDHAQPSTYDTVAKDSHEQDDRLPAGTRLGGYEVEKKLGQGGMGAVYLARQISLDRDVALKTLAPHLASDPQFVGRFTREAYAAAQLCHHNIVQIHDIGVENGVNFFSMEFVRGRHLGDVVQEHGTLDVETAVSHTLQAARGLKFAHEHGLVHRDVKPDNLLLNDLGVVKVADLGLVKKLGTNETALTASPDAAVNVDHSKTQFHVSMGTPAYMPPEQAQDAAHVDQRADIYSLGCSLYHLLTGRPPFSGKTALEVITKHTREPVKPPDEVILDLPHALTPLVLKMMAKKPENRYQTMNEVIGALEGFLGINTAGPYTPRNEDLRVLEFSAGKYHESGWARLRPKIIVGFYAACLLVAVAASLAFRDRPALAWGIAGGLVGVAVLTTIAYQISVGMGLKTAQFVKARQLAFGAGMVDWTLLTAGLAVAGLLLYTFDLHWWWLTGALLSVGIAQAFYWTVDRMADGDRRAYVTRAEHLIKQMRLKGVDESAIKFFVCKFSGEHWEEFFEALFGYDDKIKARAAWGNERGRERPRFGAWRDKFIAWIDRRLAERKAVREAKILARLEEKMLAAKGINSAVARKQAEKNAARLVDKAGAFRATAARHAQAALVLPTAPSKSKGKEESDAAETRPPERTTSVAPGKKVVQSASSAILDDHPELEHDPNYVKQTWFQRRYGTPIDFLLSPQLRLVVGVVLLACFALWWNQVMRPKAENELRAVRANTVDATVIVAKKEIKTGFDALKADQQVKADEGPVTIVGTDKRLDARLGGFQAGLAGALLVVGALFFGRMLGLFMFGSAAIALLAPHATLPVVGQPVMWMVTSAAAAVWLFGVIFFRTEPG